MQSETKTSDEAAISDEMIACRAYEKWEQRGCPHGEPEHDWFAARAELEQELTGEAKTTKSVSQ